MRISTTNPATGEAFATYETDSPSEVNRKLAAAVAAFAANRQTSLEERGRWLLRVADLLEERADVLAELASREMGKTLAAGRAEVLKCALGCRYYAEHGAEFLADEPADGPAVGASRARVRWEPLGAVLAVMPWNYPFWQVLRFVAPTVMAGNVAVLKHASNVSGCALALQSLFADAGVPEGTFQCVIVATGDVAGIIADPRIAAVTLTGSEGAGKAVASAAGSSLKKAVLELGGSDPFVVLPSADVAAAARVGVKSRFQNVGQSCIAAKRFIVHGACLDEFTAAFVEHTKALLVGDPTDAATDTGPLATASGLDEIRALVEDAVVHGAHVACGGAVLEGPGWYFQPTVLTGVTPEMRIYREEAFGPVAAIIEVDSLDEAVAVANDTEFGLSANAWTIDAAEVQALTEHLEAGAVFVNGMTASYPSLPFGGIKSSGYGRELASFGMREFCNAKTIWEA